jgi:protein involved in polysaccharide export with SLBB domain
MKPDHVSLPRPARSGAGKSLIAPGMRILVLLLAVRILAGCSTAPSWKTSEDCRSFGGDCSGIPAWQIAQDFKALSSAAIPEDSTLADAAGLKRLNPGQPRPAYRIGPLDELSITVWGAKEIWSEITDQSQQPTRVTTVLEDGTIVLPLLPSVHVGGLTVGEALKKIGTSYREVLGTSFQVDGQVTKYRSKPVLLDGAVNRPGTVYLSNEVRTLGEAIISSGGYPDIAEPSKGILVRGDRRFAIDYRSAQAGGNDLSNTELQPGDRMFFPSRESGIFYVLGEVLAPGAFPIPPKGMSLAQGLALAKGPNMLKADMESIFLVRVSEKDPRIYRLALRDILASSDQMLVPGDRIFVPPTLLSNWEETLRSLFPIFSVGAILYYIGGGRLQ